MKDKDTVTQNGHIYPSNYCRGKHPVLDEVWDILDSLRPGTLSVQARSFLAGQIWAKLILAKRGRRLEDGS